MTINVVWSGSPPAYDIGTPIEEEIDVPFNVSLLVTNDESEMITAVTMSSNIGNAVLTNGVTTGSASGTVTLQDFLVPITHVSKGSSDLIETPVIENIDLVPDNKEIYNLDVSSIATIIVTISASIDYLDNGSNPQTTNAGYTFRAKINYSAIGTWLTDYLTNRY